MNWRSLLARALRIEPRPEPKRTRIVDATFNVPPRGHIVTEITESTIRATQGESWQPPPPARRDPRRPRSDSW